MNNHQISTTDFRYLDVFTARDRVQIEHGLESMGTSPEVICWVFTKLDDVRAEYSKELFIYKQYNPEKEE